MYFDFGGAFPNRSSYGITFSSDGVLYIGTDDPGRIVVVQPNKAYSTPFTAYNTVVTPSCNNFFWGAGENLYATGGNGYLLKITARGKQSAPNYGTN
jgi:hypothetical protein